MTHIDKIYGPVEFPACIEELVQTNLMQRLKHISQDVLPRELLSWNVPSRFDHSLGVCALVSKTIAHNPHLGEASTLLYVATLLHDAGNPALSHLSEPFMRKLLGKDGESFLEETLIKSKGVAHLASLGITSDQIVRIVTGKEKPLSDIIHGSMDVDNLDNVNRYWLGHFPGVPLFDARLLATAYRFKNNRWELPESAFEEAKRWQDAREKVYGLIYGNPHQNAAMMIYRAVYLACNAGEINEDFFHLNDLEAVEYLTKCNVHSAHLAKRGLRKEWYPEVFHFETTEPSESFKERCKDEGYRSSCADYLAQKINIPRSAVCVYSGKGRDRRKIDLPFVAKDGSERSDPTEPEQLYRFKVFLDPDHVHTHRLEVIKRNADLLMGS